MNISSIFRAVTPAFLAAGALVLAAQTTSSPAKATSQSSKKPSVSSEHCTGVKINVMNHARDTGGSPRDIKVVRALYLDGSTWRTEALSDKIIPINGSASWTETLENVKDETTKIKIVFQMNIAGKWTSDRTTLESAAQKCTGGDTFTKDINGTFAP